MPPSKFYKEFTEEHCEALKKAPNVNPITKRRINSLQTISNMLNACKDKFGKINPDEILEQYMENELENKEKEVDIKEKAKKSPPQPLHKALYLPLYV